MTSIKSITQRLHSLGLKECPHGVLSGWGAEDLLTSPTPNETGLDTNSLDVREALQKFVLACKKVGDMDLTV